MTTGKRDNHSLAPAETSSLSSPPGVLIIAEDAAFAREIIGRWPADGNLPMFTVMPPELWSGSGARFDLALVGPAPPEKLGPLLASVETLAAPVIAVVDDAAALVGLRKTHGAIRFVDGQKAWPEALVLLAGEALRRLEALARLRGAEQALAANRRHAVLGRYMLEARHSLNNALTSLLGNAELLLLEPATLSADMREKLETIHTMALRLHEVMQRFSALEAEMQLTEKQSAGEGGDEARMFVSGA